MKISAIGKITLILTAVFFTSSIIAILTGPITLIPGGFESASINQFEKVEMSGINAVHVNVPDPDINIYSISGNEFDISITGTYAKNRYGENVNLSVEKTGDLLDIKIVYPHINLLLINKDFELSVGVPENYSGDIKITSASGNIEISNLNTEEFEVKSASGEIEIENIKISGSTLINSISGDVSISDLISDGAEIGSVSGEITLENVKSERISLSSVSGDINIVNSGKINSVKTTSGNIDITNYKIEIGLEIESISGDINLELAKDSSVDVFFKSSSGRLENSFGDIEDGENSVYVKTTSGDLKIYSY